MSTLACSLLEGFMQLHVKLQFNGQPKVVAAHEPTSSAKQTQLQHTVYCLCSGATVRLLR